MATHLSSFMKRFLSRSSSGCVTMDRICCRLLGSAWRAGLAKLTVGAFLHVFHELRGYLLSLTLETNERVLKDETHEIDPFLVEIMVVN